MRPYLVGRLLFGADAVVADWVADQVTGPGSTRFREPAAIGVLGPGGAIAGGVVFTNWRGHDVEVSGAAAPGFRLAPADLQLVLGYAFGQLGCTRLSMTIARRNRLARRFAERLGFRVEGVKRGGFDGRQDAILYGLQRAECRFLERARHGHS